MLQTYLNRIIEGMNATERLVGTRHSLNPAALPFAGWIEY
jgi:hypothetical protein